jgi:hypothetical protein
MIVPTSNPIHLYKLDSNTLVPEKSWEGKGYLPIRTLIKLFWGAGITSIPLALYITGCLSIFSPVQLALMVVFPMIASIWIATKNSWRFPLTLAMLVYGKYVCDDANDLIDTTIVTLISASGATTLVYLLSLIAGFDGPWIEFKRDTNRMFAYKSRFSKKLLFESSISDLAFGLHIKEGRTAKSRFVVCSLAFYDQQTPYELEHVFIVDKPESIPPDSLETYGPLCDTLKKFLKEWASGKNAWDQLKSIHGIEVRQSADSYQISLG